MTNRGTGKKVSFYLLGLMGALLFVGACRESPVQTLPDPEQDPDRTPSAPTARRDDSVVMPNPNMNLWNKPRSPDRLKERRQMVERIRNVYGLDDPNVLEAMLYVPRHWFVPAPYQDVAYTDNPLPIGQDQTISQPFIVAYMTHLLAPSPEDVVLEVGTGSGYQAAVLSELTPNVYSIEILKPLAEAARAALQRHGYTTVTVKCGDGYQGWPQAAPFDGIIVTCAPENIPAPLLDQLAPDGKIVIPVGGQWDVQDLLVVTKDAEGNITTQSMLPVRFVPLIREHP